MKLYFIAALAGYLLGSISFGYIVTRYWKKVDIRTLGSGNIGATNVYRNLGPVPGIAVFFGDFLKGLVAAYLGRIWGGELVGIVAGSAALIGHSWPLFLGFKGGKVVSTGAGVITAFNPLIILIEIVVWYGVMKISRYVSLASISAAALLPVLLLIFYFLHQISLEFMIFGFIGAALIIFKHLPNIQRLRAGTEYKVGQKPTNK